MTTQQLIARCGDFARRWGYHGFVMLNLFAWRATDPEQMKKQPDPVGPENRCQVGLLAMQSHRVVCCWGNHGRHLGQDQVILDRLAECGVDGDKLRCFGTNRDGAPTHPLYQRSDVELKVFSC